MSHREADFSPQTRRIIAARAGWRCSMPKCDRVTIGPGPRPGTSTEIGVAAHIYSSSMDGPRGAGGLIPEQRSSVSNGIWLCATHGRLIDTNNGAGYTPQLLAGWRDLHEARVAWELNAVAAPFGWIESLTVHKAPILAGTEIRFGKCNLIVGDNGAGKTAILEWLSGPIRPAKLARWAREQPGIEVGVRYYHPDAVEFSCHADDAGIRFLANGQEVAIPVPPFQLVEAGSYGGRRRCAAEELAGWTGEHVTLLPAILRTMRSSPLAFFAEVQLKENDVVVRRQGADSFSSYDALNGGEQARLRFGVAIAAASAKAAQAPTMLLLDGVLEVLDAQTARAVALALQRPEHRFQTIVTSIDDRLVAPDIAWEVIRVGREGTTAVSTEFVPSQFAGDEE
jgi:ABC-type lipoprotein export system ATPase subunit